MFGKTYKSLYLGEESAQEEKPYAGNSITRENCINHPNFKTAMLSCWINKGNEASSLRRLFFVGDSHNESLSQAADFISNKINYPVFVHSRRGTPFPLVSKDFIRPGGGSTRFDNLIQSDAENYIRSKVRDGDILIISMRFPHYFGKESSSKKEKDFQFINSNGDVMHKKEFFEKWEKAVSDLAKTFSARNAKLVIISPTPEWSENYNLFLCKPQWYRFNLTSDNCKIEKELIDREYKSIITSLERLEEKNKNIYIVDILSSLCSNGICEYTQKTNALYRDNNHLSNYASRNIVGPILFDLINKI